MTLETLDRLSLEFKLVTAGDDTATFTGFASTFNRVDRHGDTIRPGAYARTIADHKAARTMPALLWSHDPSEPIGVISSIDEERDGLKIAGRLADTARGRDARELAKMGAMTGLSIGFRTRKASTGPNGTRVLEDIDLAEISFVASPADPGARLTAIKSAEAQKGSDVIMSTETKDAGPISAAEVKTMIDHAVKTATEDLRTRLDDAELKLARPAIQTKAATEPSVESKAFDAFMRGGVERMTPDEVKSLRLSTDTTGGYLAPAEFVRELDRNLVLMSPVRTAARVASTASGSVILPRRTGTLTAQWVGETEQHQESQPAYGQIEFPIHEQAVYVDVSNKLLEDAGFSIESELSFDFAEEFGRHEGLAFVKGDGVKKPLGLAAAPGIATVKSGHASSFPTTGPFDCIMNLYHALPGFYAAGAAWGMNRTTMGTLRNLKDGQGRYLWADPIAQGQPATLLGRPVVEMPDLDDVGAGKLPVVFGDFRHFRIYDRVAIAVLRDPYSRATFGETRFHARRRVGAGVSRVEAFRFLKIEA